MRRCKFTGLVIHRTGSYFSTSMRSLHLYAVHELLCFGIKFMKICYTVSFRYPIGFKLKQVEKYTKMVVGKIMGVFILYQEEWLW